MKINNTYKKIDPLFDGHPEKSAKDMTPTERLEYLWQLVEFRLIATNRIMPELEEKLKQ